jgi:hypothetical protein
MLEMEALKNKIASYENGMLKEVMVEMSIMTDITDEKMLALDLVTEELETRLTDAEMLTIYNKIEALI